MAVNRYYSNTAAVTSLTAGVSDTAVSFTVGSTTGFPGSTPFTLIIDEDTASEELVQVTSVSGVNLTVVRGVDGTTPIAHSLGASVHHGVSARDYREPQEHIAASTTVHGLTGTVVGTSDVQTLTNKSMSGTANTFTNIPETAVTNLTTDLAAKAASAHTHAESDVTSLVSDLAAKQATSAKGAANGYASLDSNTLVPFAQLPTGTTSSTVSIGNHTHSLDKCRVYDNFGTATTSTVWARASWPAENFDPSGMHSTGTNPERINILTTGYYLIVFQFEWTANSTGTRSLNIRLNDPTSTAVAGTSLAYLGGPASSLVNRQQLTTVESLTSGDYISCYVWQNSGSNLNGNPGRDSTWVSVTQIF